MSSFRNIPAILFLNSPDFRYLRNAEQFDPERSRITYMNGIKSCTFTERENFCCYNPKFGDFPMCEECLEFFCKHDAVISLFIMEEIYSELRQLFLE